jgi:hypothetical protein
LRTRHSPNTKLDMTFGATQPFIIALHLPPLDSGTVAEQRGPAGLYMTASHPSENNCTVHAALCCPLLPSAALCSHVSCTQPRCSVNAHTHTRTHTHTHHPALGNATSWITGRNAKRLFSLRVQSRMQAGPLADRNRPTPRLVASRCYDALFNLPSCFAFLPSPSWSTRPAPSASSR